MSAICGSIRRVGLADLGLVFGPLWSPASLPVAWLVMLMAMMPPLVAMPVAHVWRSSLAGRRPQALALFGLGYAMVWFSVGVLLIPAMIILRLVMPGTGVEMVALVFAVAWNCSPAAQAARNRCHRLHRIGAFGRSADRECLAHGMMSGAACVSACWPWMLATMMFDSGHLIVMAAVTLVLFAERIAPPGRCKWQLPPALSVLWALRPAQKVFGKL